ncbi:MULTISPECIES: MBL fold metallo-hydrolase [unclassified Clostridium]|uniref:MBL fold metallo-hydrolase n=1 Tax=unclassified Clostridium TaxID=2614128 RepID=UPI00023AF8A0|nr:MULTISPECIES: MBL fold metallo-hydrolase [unclassified Clostridium]EHI96926.1 beta-lactamase domain-containing protein [Clostridium sp. DL-VIII]OOM77440.1 putative metallo-hydrolase YycJ [Clostridium sp. BL-8]
MVFCSLYSGSSGNSMFVASNKAKILIDAGLPGKKIDMALQEINEDPRELNGIFITHEHSDHIKGIGVLSRKYDIPIYANADTWSAMENSIGKVKEHNIKIIDKRSVTELNDMSIKAFNIPHDAAAPMGYTVSCGNKSVSIATDFGTFTREIYDNIKESEVILLESNHDVNMLKFGPYPYQLKRRILSEIGHLSNDDCGSAIVELYKCFTNKKIILGHLSNTNNHPDLAYQTVLNVLNQNGIKQKEDIILTMANRHNPSSYIEI